MLLEQVLHPNWTNFVLWARFLSFEEAVTGPVFLVLKRRGGSRFLMETGVYFAFLAHSRQRVQSYRR